MKSNVSAIYDITQAKSSELAGDAYVEKENKDMTEDEKEFKRQIRDRQHKIKAVMKQRKCKQIVYLVLFVIVISIYLGVNTMYTKFVFSYEGELQDNINNIDDRMLCYPFSLTLLKEMISRNQSIVSQLYGDIESDNAERYYLLQCYSDEKDFEDMLLGKTVSSGLQGIA